MGDTFTVADAYLFAVTGWGAYVKVDLSGFANISAQRVTGEAADNFYG